MSIDQMHWSKHPYVFHNCPRYSGNNYDNLGILNSLLPVSSMENLISSIAKYVVALNLLNCVLLYLLNILQKKICVYIYYSDLCFSSTSFYQTCRKQFQSEVLLDIIFKLSSKSLPELLFLLILPWPTIPTYFTLTSYPYLLYPCALFLLTLLWCPIQSYFTLNPYPYLLYPDALFLLTLHRPPIPTYFTLTPYSYLLYPGVLFLHSNNSVLLCLIRCINVWARLLFW